MRLGFRVRAIFFVFLVSKKFISDTRAPIHTQECCSPCATAGRGNLGGNCYQDLPQVHLCLRKSLFWHACTCD